MARIRTIKPEFWTDEKLGPLSPLTRLVFLGLVSQADDAGRLVDSVKLIDGLLFSMTKDTCETAVLELEQVGVITRGRTEGGRSVIQLKNWAMHQRIEKPNLKSCLPEILQKTRRKPRTNSTTNRRSVADESPPGPTTYDQRSTTNDHGSRTDDQEATPVAETVGEETSSWCSWWNSLKAGGLVSAGVTTEIPSQAVIAAVAASRKQPELRQILSDRTALEREIRASEFCRGGWFRLEKLIFGKNQDKAWIAQKLIDGAYRVREKSRVSPIGESAGSRTYAALFPEGMPE